MNQIANPNKSETRGSMEPITSDDSVTDEFKQRHPNDWRELAATCMGGFNPDPKKFETMTVQEVIKERLRESNPNWPNPIEDCRGCINPSL